MGRCVILLPLRLLGFSSYFFYGYILLSLLAYIAIARSRNIHALAEYKRPSRRHFLQKKKRKNRSQTPGIGRVLGMAIKHFKFLHFR
jgi:hypothetical protein